MKNVKFLLSVIVMICMMTLSYAQVVGPSTYVGSYTGKDNLGNSVQLDLNANWTCTFKVNGVPSCNIIIYRLIFQTNDGGGIVNPYKPEIWFYTSTPNTGSVTNGQNGAMPINNAPPNIMYKGNAELDVNLTNLEVSVLGLPVTNPVKPNFLYKMDVKK